MIKSEKLKKRIRRKKGIRAQILQNVGKLRLTIFKSNKYIYAQIINDLESKTVASFNDKKLTGKKTKLERATEVGKKLAELATKNGVNEVIFDRNGYKYHGRVKALADGARESGLKF